MSREQAAVQVGGVEIVLVESDDGPQLVFSELDFTAGKIKIVGGQDGVLDFGRMHGVRPGIAKIFVHPDQLSDLMNGPDFLSAAKYPGPHEPGEVGRFRATPVFVRLEADPVKSPV